MVIGSPATGKTTAIHKIFEMVERKSQKVATAYVNCQLYNTRFNIFAQIYKQLFGFLPAGTGVPFSRIYGEIMKKLSNEKKALVVALDDVNHLFYHKNANQILYDILRAYEVFPGVRTGVFAIISDIEFRFLLDKNVSSVFIPQEVMFQTYTWQEMRDILNERVKSGFYPSVVPDEILDEIVDVTSSTGDLRVGIDLLRTSGNFAEADASKTIAKKHLDKALHDIGSQSIQNTLDNLSADERELLRVLVQRGDDNPTAGDLYNTLKEYRSLSYASFDRVLKKLEFMRIIDTKFTGKGKRGNSRLILLRFDSKELGKWLD
ncbi:ATPase AAA [Methanobacterium petrolearium]|nr:ATPase AAA [Methanobacterium petrolearium]